GPAPAAASGGRGEAGTCTPKAAVSGGGGRDWALERRGAASRISVAKNAERGSRNAEQVGRRPCGGFAFRIPTSGFATFRVPRSAFPILFSLAPYKLSA